MLRNRGWVEDGKGGRGWRAEDDILEINCVLTGKNSFFFERVGVISRKIGLTSKNGVLLCKFPLVLSREGFKKSLEPYSKLAS